MRTELKDFAFQYFDAKTIFNSDDLTVVIRSHLLVESFLERLLRNYMDLSEFDEQDLTFGRKLKMTHGLGLLDDLYPSIKRLNKIRNDFAHNIQMKLENTDISIFIKFFEKNNDSENPVWKASKENKKARLGVVIHYLLKRLATLIEASKVAS